ncbi:unnamed protein product [Mytilus coruscus]|uniref:TRIM2_3 n=1 Tax=Mytilus coruscus TaxID=42192 RepID=A0A6J8CW76_MYTCO|nr:unnamed protein product [Mytilus coruscus]
MQIHSVEYKINTAIQNILTDMKSFGDVDIEAKPCEIILRRKKTKQAQIMVPAVQSRSIENTKLMINQTIHANGNYIVGCCMLPDGRMVFTYYSKLAVKVFSYKGLIDFEVMMPCNPFDIVYISQDNTLAVTSGGSDKHCIAIIDVEKKQIKKTITLDLCNYGITMKDSRLIYCGDDKGIRMINPYDESISEIVEDKMPHYCYTAAFGNHIYHSNVLTNVVTCYDQQGKPQWTFHNESVLKNPRGIDLDNDGNVYVMGTNSNNVVVIFPDGQRHREVLTASDGLVSPFSLCYNNSKKQLLVVNYSDVDHLYNFI